MFAYQEHKSHACSDQFYAMFHEPNQELLESINTVKLFIITNI